MPACCLAGARLAGPFLPWAWFRCKEEKQPPPQPRAEERREGAERDDRGLQKHQAPNRAEWAREPGTKAPSPTQAVIGCVTLGSLSPSLGLHFLFG